jgi:drug/metabolite transporter (DMT)-like permease
VISIFAGVLLLHEHLRYYQVIGALLIIIGVIGTNYFAADKRESRQKA